MKISSNRYIIIISALALFGIIILQLAATNQFIQIKKQLQTEHIKFSMHSFSQKVCRDSLLNNTTKLKHELAKCLEEHLTKETLIPTYEMAILNHKKDTILYSNLPLTLSDIKEFPYTEFGLCTSMDEDIYLYLNINNDDSKVYNYIIIWTSLSLLLIVIVSLSFYYVVSKSRKQYKLSHIKNDFINNMSHELKTPIATMSVASEMLINKEVHTDMQRTTRYAQIIRDESLRLRNLVDKVLNIAIFEKQQPEFKFENVEIHDLLEAAIKPFEIIVEKKEGILNTYLEATQTHIKGDKAHLLQSISNLIDNAIKYSPKELDIRISTRNTESYICIEVEDKGLGIDKKEKDRIFEKFHRLSTGDVHDIKGFGIGLYYVKQVIEHHKGKLDVTSKGKRGSRFSFFLPLIIQNQ